MKEVEMGGECSTLNSLVGKPERRKS